MKHYINLQGFLFTEQEAKDFYGNYYPHAILSEAVWDEDEERYVVLEDS